MLEGVWPQQRVINFCERAESFEMTQGVCEGVLDGRGADELHLVAMQLLLLEDSIPQGGVKPSWMNKRKAWIKKTTTLCADRPPAPRRSRRAPHT